MLAMTLIERALLTERPAFFVVAAQRGGGKTTLVNMITLAALGRRAAAAAWSDTREERKKALFSYLRQGVACLAWDNIPRGATITCPHIEAALTAAEISDRVLGVSRVETVPSTTVQIFTGNAIGPRGDMTSRSLMLALNVDRPDPENRSFVHPDPLAWTRAHRRKIVQALYVLLVAGALNRPPNQEAKTRFKGWWTLVGWPMEYAAGLLGINVDCTELMRAGEAGDEEASATSAALTILHEILARRSFTAKDVVKVIEAKDIKWADPAAVDEAAKAQAEALADALGELDGRRLDRPTAHKIGKLFQKRLVGRPALIGDDQIATLRRTKDHEENTYQVEVSTPGKNNPDNPDIPRAADQKWWGRGMSGKTGKFPASSVWRSTRIERLQCHQQYGRRPRCRHRRLGRPGHHRLRCPGDITGAGLLGHPAARRPRTSRSRPPSVGLGRPQADEGSTNDWRAFFDEHVGIAEVDGGLPRPAAEARAFDCCVAEWLYRTAVISAPGPCPICGDADRPNDPLLAIGIVWRAGIGCTLDA